MRSVRGKEVVNVQVRRIQQESDGQTQGAYHLNLVTNLFRFIDESDDSPVTGFAVRDFESMPESAKDSITEEDKSLLEDGRHLYLQVKISEIVKMVDEIDTVDHRRRIADSGSVYRDRHEVPEIYQEDDQE